MGESYDCWRTWVMRDVDDKWPFPTFPGGGVGDVIHEDGKFFSPTPKGGSMHDIVERRASSSGRISLSIPATHADGTLATCAIALED